MNFDLTVLATATRFVCPCAPQKAISEEVAFKYNDYSLQVWGNGGYDTISVDAVPEGTVNWKLPRIGRVAMLRRVCQLSGFQVAAKAYDWTTLAPVAAEVHSLHCVCAAHCTCLHTTLRSRIIVTHPRWLCLSASVLECRMW